MFKRMLVPIDGSHTSATIVPYAAKLAKRLDCAMDLLLVESPDGPKLPHPEHHRPDTRRSGSALVAGTKTPEHIREANQRYIARHVEECEALAKQMLGSVLRTHQTGPEGRVVRRLLIEQGMDLSGSKEMYLAVIVDRPPRAVCAPDRRHQHRGRGAEDHQADQRVDEHESASFHSPILKTLVMPSIRLTSGMNSASTTASTIAAIANVSNTGSIARISTASRSNRAT